MKPKVLMIAYACDPEGSGEHWLGWGWAEQAARSFEVHLITPPKSRESIERHAAKTGMCVHFVELPAWRRALSEQLGSVGSWLRKFWWQKLAARRAVALHAREHFALVHQTTFHTFRVPFAAALQLRIPSVWGPIAGGEHTPSGFENFLGAARSAERWRRISNRLSLALPAVQRSLRAADALFVSNRTTLDFLPADCRGKATLVSPNALRAEDVPSAPKLPRAASDGLSLFYAGNCVATRCMPLVFQALARLRDARITLAIAGKGPALDDWKREARELGLGETVHFAGQVMRDQLARFYAEADALVFPALRDAGGSSVLEAMSLGLPVVCFDWGGPAEMLDAESGIKVSVATPEAAIDGLAAAFVKLRYDPPVRAALGARAVARARVHFTWEAKRRLLEATYSRLIGLP